MNLRKNLDTTIKRCFSDLSESVHMMKKTAMNCLGLWLFFIPTIC